MINALKYTQELERVGFSREQAEASVNILFEVMDQNFATKADLKELAQHMDAKFQAVDARFENLRSEMREIEYKMTIKLGTIVTIALGACTAIVRLIH